MIAIDNTLVSDELMTEQFVCDLQRCKGGCCIDGDAGAPLEEAEKQLLQEVFEQVKPYLPKRSLAEIEKQGFFVYNDEFGWVTPAINGGICVYATTNAQGVVQCGIEKAYNDGKIAWKKPISCHLFPVRISASEDGQTEYLNYEPRPDLCKPACRLGKKLKVPVYQFLKEAITRKYGQQYYEALDAIKQQYFTEPQG